MKRWVLPLLVLLAAGLPAPAAADFSPFAFASTGTLPADYAGQSAISADGRYIAFTGSVAGVPGIYRKDLDTGALVLVAAGHFAAAVGGLPSSQAALDVGAPSISADGTYVAFTSTDATAPSTSPGTRAPAQGCASVWRADLTNPASPVYVLVSVPNGAPNGADTAQSLTYAGSGQASCPGGGSAAAGRVAMSGDGSEIAFTVIGASNLCPNAPAPTGPPPSCLTPVTSGSGTTPTPPAQVAVRNLDTATTTLVSQTTTSLGAEPAPVPSGAALTVEGTLAPGTEGYDPGASTASISADGSTVAWLGIDIPAQAPASSAASGPYPTAYDEPLWRAIAGPDAGPTRRVLCDETGGPAADACGGPLNLQYCVEGKGECTGTSGSSRPVLEGAFAEGIAPSSTTIFSAAGGTITAPRQELSLVDGTPQLSANGQMVALVSNAPPLGADPCAALAANCENGDIPTPDAYLVNMAPGLSRDAAVTRVTEWASDDFNPDQTGWPLTAPIDGIAISPEGDRVAFVTRRLVFPYSPPALITPAPAYVTEDQLYVADLGDGTLSLVSTGYDGQPADNTVFAPSFSAADGPIAFPSSATNLVYGAASDLSGGGPEIFTTTELKPPATPGFEVISAPPANPTVAPEYVLSATSAGSAGDAVVIDVDVPGAGTVAAGAQAGVPVPVAAARVRGRPAARRGRRRRGHARKALARPARVVVRTVAGASATALGAGIVQLELVPGSVYLPAIDAAHGLYATVTITFTAPGEPTLTDTLPVVFAPASVPGASHVTAAGKTRRARRKRRRR